MKNQIVIFGSIVQDLISYTDRFPQPGESVRGTSFYAGAGGKGANQAVAAAKLGANVAMIGYVGDDMFGEINIESMKRNNVDTTRIKKSIKSNTATATITVDNKGENSIVVTLGANLELLPAIADQNFDILSSASIVLCQGEIPESANRKAFEIARQHGVTTFLNPAPGDANIDRTILKFVDIICTNENEAEFITGIKAGSIHDAIEAAKQMVKIGPKYSIITLGSKGVLLATKGNDNVEHIQVETVNAVDTTGAGDCFCGSLAALLARKQPINVAVQCAANLAALSVTRKGTQTSYWNLDEVQQFHPLLLPSQFFTC